MSKVCFKCKQEKSLEDFSKNKNGILGVCVYCKLCDNIRNKQYRSDHPSFAKGKHLQQRFGLSVETREVLLDKQERKCRVCGTSDPGTRGWQIDHDHQCCPGRRSCGKCIRGLLCIWCNKGLGDFEDNPVFLLNAVQYLSVGAVS